MQSSVELLMNHALPRYEDKVSQKAGKRRQGLVMVSKQLTKRRLAILAAVGKRLEA